MTLAAARMGDWARRMLTSAWRFWRSPPGNGRRSAGGLGSVSFVINQVPRLVREPGLQDALVPGVRTPTQVRLTIAADGARTVSLSDKDDRPRSRLTVKDEGFGAIEFLNAERGDPHDHPGRRDSISPQTR